MWNHFDNEEERTQNRVEGDNNKMRLFCGAAKRFAVDSCITCIHII